MNDQEKTVLLNKVAKLLMQNLPNPYHNLDINVTKKTPTAYFEGGGITVDTDGWLSLRFDFSPNLDLVSQIALVLSRFGFRHRFCSNTEEETVMFVSSYVNKLEKIGPSKQFDIYKRIKKRLSTIHKSSVLEPTKLGSYHEQQ
ncbi:MAG: hypothetical protein HOO06_13740 [Bdellovibrionaceae bacterium]|nr:hypothetical protein [Pseudobdellovibrionaceae bacterium]